ncbi:MAG: PhzF family phenazine biosynthesis protein [Oscillatoriales cyanobacterium]|nr:MAG: PhzF family phenazine biosynthesis protein [Oscillatoriales cyanobacterium]
MTISIYQVDAFSDRPFGGNPAAVCVLEQDQDDTWMQAMAAEMNLSETAFLQRLDENRVSLRWFTPTVEVDLCGHATLATAHVLWESGAFDRGATIEFETLSGSLFARRIEEWIELDFPAQPVRSLNPVPSILLEGLGLHEAEFVGTDGVDYVVEVERAATVRQLCPNQALLERLPVRGVTITAAADDDDRYDFISRFFAPAAGIPEDPVTGSAHCSLATYWASRLLKTDFLAYQASDRGGELQVSLVGDRVKICGKAVTVFVGQVLA